MKNTLKVLLAMMLALVVAVALVSCNNDTGSSDDDDDEEETHECEKCGEDADNKVKWEDESGWFCDDCEEDGEDYLKEHADDKDPDEDGEPKKDDDVKDNNKDDDVKDNNKDESDHQYYEEKDNDSEAQDDEDHIVDAIYECENCYNEATHTETFEGRTYHYCDACAEEFEEFKAGYYDDEVEGETAGYIECENCYNEATNSETINGVTYYYCDDCADEFEEFKEYLANYTGDVANTEAEATEMYCANCGEPATMKVDLDDDIIEWYACSESCYVELVNFYNEVFG